MKTKCQKECMKKIIFANLAKMDVKNRKNTSM